MLRHYRSQSLENNNSLEHRPDGRDDIPHPAHQTNGQFHSCIGSFFPVTTFMSSVNISMGQLDYCRTSYRLTIGSLIKVFKSLQTMNFSFKKSYRINSRLTIFGFLKDILLLSTDRNSCMGPLATDDYLLLGSVI